MRHADLLFSSIWQDQILSHVAEVRLCAAESWVRAYFCVVDGIQDKPQACTTPACTMLTSSSLQLAGPDPQPRGRGGVVRC
jgi:hypothetical protein